MAQELNWSLSRKRQEMKDATAFLASMGLPSGAKVPEIEPHGLLEKLESALWWAIGGGNVMGTRPGKVQSVTYSRAQFEAGEIDILRAAFWQRAAVISPVDQSRNMGGKNFTEAARLKKTDVQPLLKELPGYEVVHPKDFEYVLEQAGLGGKDDMDFNEFVEVCVQSFAYFGSEPIRWEGLRRLERSIHCPRFRAEKSFKIVAKEDSG